MVLLVQKIYGIHGGSNQIIEQNSDVMPVRDGNTYKLCITQ